MGGLNMEECKICMHEAKVGMQLSRAIFSHNGLLLLPKQAILTPKVIIRLKLYGVEELFIFKQGKNEVLRESEVESYITHTRETKAFKIFDESHSQSVKLVKNAFNGMLKDNNKIDTEALISDVDNLLKTSKNGIQVFDMLHCMRDYDDSTYVHSINVSLICNVIGTWVGFSKEDVQILTLCGLLHDVGKLMMPKEIICKPGQLTTLEYATIKTHPYMGYSILQEDIDEHVKKAVLQHHEKCDGSGYPNGLKKNQIDEFAKIVTIADIYDAMTANRVYREGLCPFDVIELFEMEGFQKYDPYYLLIFLERMVESYINRRVRLSNNDEGQIIMINKSTLSKPVVCVHNEYIDLSRVNDLSIKTLL